MQRRFVLWLSARLRQGFVPVCDWFRKIAPTSWCRPEIYQSLSYLFPWLCSFIVIVFFFKFNSDPYEELWQTQDVDADKCDNTCDALAACACGLVYGDYKCACPKGFAGSGVVGDCNGKWQFIINYQYNLLLILPAELQYDKKDPNNYFFLVCEATVSRPILHNQRVLTIFERWRREIGWPKYCSLDAICFFRSTPESVRRKKRYIWSRV